MEDGGCSAHARAAAAAAKKKKEKNDAATPRHPVPFAEIPGITDALRDRLVALGATEPSFMIAKSLVMSDVNSEQARLLFSCKRELPSQVTGVFAETEMQFVQDKDKTTGGLLVTALDRAGRSYDLTCKYLASNVGYRFITGWKAYVNDNALDVAMRVELWWFRSRKMHNRYELHKGEDEKEKKVPVTVESGHPDGSLGLVLLQYENGMLEELEQAAANKPDEAPPVQEMETVHMESKVDVVISRQEEFYAALGLLELKKHFGGCGGGGGGGRGGGDNGSGGSGNRGGGNNDGDDRGGGCSRGDHDGSGGEQGGREVENQEL